MTTCTRARALLFLQRSTFLNTVNLIIIGCNGIRNQMFLDTCIVQAERTLFFFFIRILFIRILRLEIAKF